MQKANNKLADLKPTISITTSNIKVHVHFKWQRLPDLNHRRARLGCGGGGREGKGRKEVNEESTEKKGEKRIVNQILKVTDMFSSPWGAKNGTPLSN